MREAIITLRQDVQSRAQRTIKLIPLPKRHNKGAMLERIVTEVRIIMLSLLTLALQHPIAAQLGQPTMVKDYC